MAEEFIFIGRNKQNRQAAAKIRKTTTTEAGNLYKPSARRPHAPYTQGRAGAQCKLNALLGGRAKMKKKSRTAGTKRRAALSNFLICTSIRSSGFKKSAPGNLGHLIAKVLLFLWGTGWGPAGLRLSSLILNPLSSSPEHLSLTGRRETIAQSSETSFGVKSGCGERRCSTQKDAGHPTQMIYAVYFRCIRCEDKCICSLIGTAGAFQNNHSAQQETMCRYLFCQLQSHFTHYTHLLSFSSNCGIYAVVWRQSADCSFSTTWNTTRNIYKVKSSTDY